MDFVAVMLFTQQVFCLEFILLFHIKSQPDVAYKSVNYKRAFNVVFGLLKMNKQLSCEFIFVFILFLLQRHLCLATKPGGPEKI